MGVCVHGGLSAATAAGSGVNQHVEWLETMHIVGQTMIMVNLPLGGRQLEELATRGTRASWPTAA